MDSARLHSLSLLMIRPKSLRQEDLSYDGNILNAWCMLVITVHEWGPCQTHVRFRESCIHSEQRRPHSP